MAWYDDPAAHAMEMQAELNRMSPPDPSLDPCRRALEGE